MRRPPASVLAFGALHTAQQAAPEYRRSALVMLGRTEETEAAARRAYKTERNRRWFRSNPNGADTVAADTARDRTAQYLMATRLKQLRERAVGRGRAVDGPAARARRPAPRWRHNRGGDRVSRPCSRIATARWRVALGTIRQQLCSSR